MSDGAPSANGRDVHRPAEPSARTLTGPVGGRAPAIGGLVALAVVPLGSIWLPAGAAACVLAAAVTAVAWSRRDGPVVLVGAMAVLLALLGVIGVPFGLWFAVLGPVVASRRVRWIGPPGGWVPPGRASPRILGFAALTVVGAAAALAGWVATGPQLGAATEELIELARVTPPIVVGLSVVVFVVVNATAEEVAYRVVAFDVARRLAGPWLAVVVQAAAFGTLHVAGFPAGLAGMALTFLYGLALGAIRLLTGGLRLAIGVHMLADATIAALVLAVLL